MESSATKKKVSGGGSGRFPRSDPYSPLDLSDETSGILGLSTDGRYSKHSSHDEDSDKKGSLALIPDVDEKKTSRALATFLASLAPEDECVDGTEASCLPKNRVPVDAKDLEVDKDGNVKMKESVADMRVRDIAKLAALTTKLTEFSLFAMDRRDEAQIDEARRAFQSFIPVHVYRGEECPAGTGVFGGEGGKLAPMRKAPLHNFNPQAIRDSGAEVFVVDSKGVPSRCYPESLYREDTAPIHLTLASAAKGLSALAESETMFRIIDHAKEAGLLSTDPSLAAIEKAVSSASTMTMGYPEVSYSSVLLKNLTIAFRRARCPFRRRPGSSASSMSYVTLPRIADMIPKSWMENLRDEMWRTIVRCAAMNVNNETSNHYTLNDSLVSYPLPVYSPKASVITRFDKTNPSDYKFADYQMKLHGPLSRKYTGFVQGTQTLTFEQNTGSGTDCRRGDDATKGRSFNADSIVRSSNAFLSLPVRLAFYIVADLCGKFLADSTYSAADQAMRAAIIEEIIRKGELRNDDDYTGSGPRMTAEQKAAKKWEDFNKEAFEGLTRGTSLWDFDVVVNMNKALGNHSHVRNALLNFINNNNAIVNSIVVTTEKAAQYGLTRSFRNWVHLFCEPVAQRQFSTRSTSGVPPGTTVVDLATPAFMTMQVAPKTIESISYERSRIALDLNIAASIVSFDRDAQTDVGAAYGTNDVLKYSATDLFEPSLVPFPNVGSPAVRVQGDRYTMYEDFVRDNFYLSAKTFASCIHMWLRFNDSAPARSAIRSFKTLLTGTSR